MWAQKRGGKERAGTGGVILFTLEQIPVEKDPAYYHFWLGIINSVDKEKKARAFQPMYGFTMINGRFIKTGRIQSADGLTYFDLDEGVISGNIKIKGNSDYATKTELQVVSDQIKGEVGKFNAQLGGTKAQLDAFQQQTQQPVQTEPDQTQEQSGGGSSGVYYANCKEARAAGAAPRGAGRGGLSDHAQRHRISDQRLECDGYGRRHPDGADDRAAAGWHHRSAGGLAGIGTGRPQRPGGQRSRNCRPVLRLSAHLPACQRQR